MVRGGRPRRGETREEALLRREEERALREEEAERIQKELRRRSLMEASSLHAMLSYRACGILFGMLL